MRKKAFLIVGIISFFGVILFSLSSAAVPTLSLEPESTSSNIRNPARMISNNSASGSKAIQFSAGGNNAIIPSRFVGGYLEWWSGVYPSQIDSRYNLLFHAFATVNSSGSVNMELAVDRQRLATEYKQRKLEGKPTILSIGGAGGAASGLNSTAEVQSFLNSVNPLIDEFGFSGIDWDLEVGVPGGISINGLVSASRQLKVRHGTNFAITMAPFEGIEYPYKDIARELGNDLTFVGFQFYNMSDKVNSQNAIARMKEWMRDCNLREDQFSIGFWYGPDDWRKYVVEESQMASIYSAVRTAHPGVRGTWTWAIATTDRPRNYAFPKALNPGVY